MLEMLSIAMLGYAVIMMMLIAGRKRRHFGLKHYESRPLPGAGCPLGLSSSIGLSDGS